MVFSASITTSGTTRPLLSSTITTIHAAEMKFRPGTCWRIDLGSGPSFLSDTLSTCTCMVSSIQRRRSNYPNGSAAYPPSVLITRIPAFVDPSCLIGLYTLAFLRVAPFLQRLVPPGLGVLPCQPCHLLVRLYPHACPMELPIFEATAWSRAHGSSLHDA
jgi:hypothetical protein